MNKIKLFVALKIKHIFSEMSMLLVITFSSNFDQVFDTFHT